MTSHRVASSIPVARSAASARWGGSRGYATILYLMYQDIERERSSGDAAVRAVIDHHGSQIDWPPSINPYRFGVMTRNASAVQHALHYIAISQRRSFPKSLVEAMLLDTGLGIVPVLGNDICVQLYLAKR